MINFFKKIYLLIILSFFLLISSVYAAGNLNDAFHPGAGKPLGDVGRELKYDVEVIYEEGFDPIIGTIIQATLSLLGIIFIILIIYGGGLWMTAKGNEQQVDKAKDLITAAIIGLVIVVAAYAISYFVIQTIGKGSLKNL